jgi:hypothetical protein
MNIYLFNPENGAYLEEDSVDKALMKQGGYVLPSNATTFGSPEGGRGNIFVFDIVAQCWEVRSHRDKENLRVNQPAQKLRNKSGVRR